MAGRLPGGAVRRGALRDDPAVVQHRDPAGQPVGLVQVLRDQEDGQVVHRGELAGDADRGADRVRGGGHVVAGHRYHAAVGRDQGGQDPHDRGLACAVGLLAVPAAMASSLCPARAR